MTDYSGKNDRWEFLRDIDSSGELTVGDKTTALWLQMKVVQLGSKRVETLQEVKKRQLEEASGSQVVRNIGRILDSKAGTDFKIETSCGRVFHVHRCILAGKKGFVVIICHILGWMER
jgi:hypothetical protein